MTKKKAVLITGAAGRIGTILRKALWEKYELSGIDRVPVPGLPGVTADLTDFAAMLPAFQGKEVVVHLAAEPRLLEAARDRSLHSLAPAPTGGTQAGEPYVACRHDGANIEPVRSRYSPGRPVRERRSMTTLAGERSVAW